MGSGGENDDTSGNSFKLASDLDHVDNGAPVDGDVPAFVIAWVQDRGAVKPERFWLNFLLL